MTYELRNLSTEFSRLNELITKEAEYNPKMPGVRTRGDHFPANFQGEIKVYFGLDRVIGHVGGSAAYAASVTGFPAILNTGRNHGLRNYSFLYSVNSSEATQIMSIAESIIRFMAYGPDAKPFQFADKLKDIPEEHRHDSKRGLPTGIFYSKEIKRPITPVYELMNKSELDEKALINSVNYLFEVLTLRPPNKTRDSKLFSSS